MNKILLHVCCAPCATYPVPWLREREFEIKAYFYNPNIHPYSEYLKRQGALKEYVAALDLPIIFDQAHDPAQHLRAVCFREEQRCQICYQMRLEQSARVARRGDFDCFSSTLLVSKWQKHDLIRELGEAAGARYGIPFFYHDFREGFAETGTRSRSMGLYRQQYCGCIYSEFERYGGAKLLKKQERLFEQK